MGDIVILTLDFNILVQSKMSDYVVVGTIPSEFSPHAFKIVAANPQLTEGGYPIMVTVSDNRIRVYTAGLHESGRVGCVFVYTTT